MNRVVILDAFTGFAVELSAVDPPRAARVFAISLGNHASDHSLVAARGESPLRNGAQVLP